MRKNLSYLKAILMQAIESAGFEVKKDDLHLEPTKTLEYGHFSTNMAMLLAGKIGQSSIKVAQTIVSRIKDHVISRAEVAGAGFINLWLEQKFYTTEIVSVSKNLEKYLTDTWGKKMQKNTMVIEYSSPNIAKPLGVHHLLSTVIGESLKRIYKAYGYHVIAENYPGDIGTQFGKLMVAIKTWGDEKIIEKNPIDELLALYVRFHEEAEKHPELEDEARAEYKKFETGDREARRLWKRIVDWSFKEIQPLYDRLGVVYDGVHSESFFEDKMKDILDEGRSKEIFVDGEAGAWIVRPDNPEDSPAMVKKSDGTTLYLTRDLAQMKFFEQEYHPDIMVWVVDVAQSLHFKQRFEVSRKLGLTSAELVHVAFGRMEFRDKAMSTRKGNIIRLSELLDEAEQRAEKLAREKTKDFPEKGLSSLARIIGIGAVKYSILSQNRIQNITFDWDRMLALEGNSAPYLMYTAARANSILQKGNLSACDTANFQLSLAHPLETVLARDILLYPGILERAAIEFKPHHIANYLYDIAQAFNRLYNELPVLYAEQTERQTRLLLTAATKTIMEHGLGLLSIDVPEKM